MHPNPAFRGAEAARNVAFARERGFGVLTLAGEDGPLVSHIPFVLNADADTLTAHIVRSNPIWRALRAGPADAVMVVSGPDGYVSPDWYGTPDQVPTWNYVAVHIRGPLQHCEEATLRGHVDELSAQFEERLSPKPVWTAKKMAPDALARMMRMIAPIEMTVEAIDGTWKLNQNKADGVRRAAADRISTSRSGSEIEALAALMRDPPR